MRLIAGSGIEAVFPLWGRDSRSHAEGLIDAGVSARVCSVNPTELTAKRVGRYFDLRFLSELPLHVDPSGEDDEFHTFVEWAPGWSRKVNVNLDSVIERYGLSLANFRTRSEPRASVLSFKGCRRVEDHDPFEYFERLRRVRCYVHEHLPSEIRLSTVAGIAALEPSGFGRYFRRHVGTTFGAWLIQYRIELACQMMRERDIGVGDAGRAVGYAHRRSFRRVFRQQTGYSPSEYRRLYLTGNRAARREYGTGRGTAQEGDCASKPATI